MFGMGGTEILVILIVALLFLGPDKLPDAAKKISKGIRDIKRQSRALQRTIEDDEHIGGAIRDLRSALRGEDEPYHPPPMKPRKELDAATPAIGAAAAALAAGPPEATEATEAGVTAGAGAPDASAEGTADTAAHAAEVHAATQVFADPASDAPKLTLPPTAGEAEPGAAGAARNDAADLAVLVKPAPNTVARGASTAAQAPAAPASAAPAPAASASAAPASATASAEPASAEASAAASGEPSGLKHG